MNFCGYNSYKNRTEVSKQMNAKEEKELTKHMK